MNALLVFLGGGLGAAARHGVNVAGLRAFGPGFPWGTFAVNVVGSLAMGLLVGAALKFELGTSARLFLATGFLGGFTTFSAFALDVANLSAGRLPEALGYIVGSVALSILAVFAGLSLVRAL